MKIVIMLLLIFIISVPLLILFLQFELIIYDVKYNLAGRNIEMCNHWLVHDKNEFLRCELTKNCSQKYLDILVNDKN